MVDITVKWADQADNESGFEIFRGTESGALSSVGTVGANTTSYVDTGRTEDQTYYYRVEAYTAHATASTPEASVVTPLLAPTNLSASINGDDIDLSWTVDYDTSIGTLAVERSTDGGETWTELTSGLAAGTTAYTDTAPDKTPEYTYRVIRSATNATAVSEPVTIAFPTEFAITIIETNSPVDAGETLSATVLVENTGGPGSDNITLSVQEQ